MHRSFKTGLVLAGGGARAAYQVGVLKAIANILPKGSANPFPVISGTSAGAINGTALAIFAPQFHMGIKRLTAVWENFRVKQVFRADALGVLSNSARWLATLMVGGLGKYNPQALLDRTPLYHLLKSRMPCEKIQYSIDSGALHALGVTASGYTSGQSVTFFQGREDVVPWRRVRRIGIESKITIDHLMASSAIPFFFSAVHIHREYFGDGSMRQIAPLSPALHLGADRVLVIGVRKEYIEPEERVHAEDYPSIAQIAGHALNSIFLDALDTDLERLHRINKTIRLMQARGINNDDVFLRKAEAFTISPSHQLDDIAIQYAHMLPWPIEFLFRGIGAYRKGGANLLSYLLFEQDYCKDLIALGYEDAMVKKEELKHFLTAPTLD